MGLLRDRSTGKVLDVEVVHADYADWDPDVPCSVCGGALACSIQDPDGSGFGVEISPFIHREREDDWPCECGGDDGDCTHCEGSGVIHTPS